MKTNFLLILLLLITIFFFTKIHAAYLQNVPQTLTQPDGSILECFATGDEFYNYLHDESGYTIIKNQATN